MIALRILALLLVALAGYALYLPAALPPERFLQQLSREHERNLSFWGAERAERLLSRAFSVYGQRAAVVPAAFTSAPQAAVGGANAALAGQMAEVMQRLAHNRYAQALDAAVLLAAYRLSVLAEWLPWVTGFLLLACVDGYVVRSIRSKEFLEASPTRFALCSIGATLALALILLLLIAPAVIDPMLFGGAPLTLGILIARALSHFRP